MKENTFWVNQRVTCLKIQTNSGISLEMVQEIRKKGDVDTLTAENYYEHFVKLNEDLADWEESEPTYVGERQEEFGNINLDNSNLNRPFAIEELRKGIKYLKNGKGSGLDKVVNENLKANNDMMLLAYVNLLNIILDTGHISDNWTIGIIKPIFKNKGSKNDTDNYRGITLFGLIDYSNIEFKTNKPFRG